MRCDCVRSLSAYDFVCPKTEQNSSHPTDSRQGSRRGGVAGVAGARVDLSITSTTANASLFSLRLIAKNHVQQETMDFNVAAVINKTTLSKFVHERTHARSRHADHLRQCLLADSRDNWLRPTFFAKMRQEQKDPRHRQAR
jgi:hypothetical protein